MKYRFLLLFLGMFFMYRPSFAVKWETLKGTKNVCNDDDRRKAEFLFKHACTRANWHEQKEATGKIDRKYAPCFEEFGATVRCAWKTHVISGVGSVVTPTEECTFTYPMQENKTGRILVP